MSLTVYAADPFRSLNLSMHNAAANSLFGSEIKIMRKRQSKINKLRIYWNNVQGASLIKDEFYTLENGVQY